MTTAQPRRMTGRFQVSHKRTAARLDGMEAALRMNLSSVLSDALDDQAINGSGTGDGTINGLFNRLSDPSNPSSGQETFARYVAAVRLARRWIIRYVDLAGVRMLIGPQTYRHAVSVFRANESAMTAEGWATDRTGGVRESQRRVSRHPLPTISSKQSSGVRIR